MSQATLDAYIFHPGDCREAMEYYKSIFGGEVTYMDMSQMPGVTPDKADKIMHSHLKGGIINLMGSDGDGSRTEKYGQGAISLSISGDNEAELRAAFDALAKDATEVEPIAKQFWGDLFGGLTDKYGIEWIFNINQAA